jgi:hypothetical protein
MFSLGRQEDGPVDRRNVLAKLCQRFQGRNIPLFVDLAICLQETQEKRAETLLSFPAAGRGPESRGPRSERTWVQGVTTLWCAGPGRLEVQPPEAGSFFPSAKIPGRAGEVT